MNDHLAPFIAHFDSECDCCFSEILMGEPMAYDKLEDQYVCHSCFDELRYQRLDYDEVPD